MISANEASIKCLNLCLHSGLINIIHNFNHSSTFQPVTLFLLTGIEATQCIKLCHCVDVLEIMYIAGRGQEKLPAVQKAGLIKPCELLKLVHVMNSL